jgi:hypothetical protein
MMKNWKGLGRKRSWPNFKALNRHSPGMTDENQEKPQSGQPDHFITTFLLAGQLLNHSKASGNFCQVLGQSATVRFVFMGFV